MSFWNSFPSHRVLAELSPWSADLARLADELQRSDPFADMYHLDAADGHFSPQFLLFPDLVARLRSLTEKAFHVHIMAKNDILLNQIEQFVEAGADLITIWQENAEVVPEALHKIRDANVAAGISLGLEVPPEAIVPFLAQIELVTLMGTKIGVKGQDLDERAYERIRTMRKLIEEHGYTDRIKIAADGGIRSHTVPGLRAAGADTVVMGSLAYGSKDLKQTFDWLHSLNVKE